MTTPVFYRGWSLAVPASDVPCQAYARRIPGTCDWLGVSLRDLVEYLIIFQSADAMVGAAVGMRVSPQSIRASPLGWLP
jgi:hypothetical protein